MTEISKPILITGTVPEVRLAAFQAAFESSGGVLNDQSEAGALYALFNAQAEAIVAINGNLNAMVDAATINLLRSLGIVLDDGGRAVVTLTYLLTGQFSTPVTINRFQVRRNGIIFYTEGRATIPAGQSTFQMTARALVYGTAGNVSAGPRVGDWEILEPQPYLLRVTSTEPAAGGRRPESTEDVRLRSTPIWGEEVCIRVEDFERVSRRFLGDGSPVLAIPKMGADKRLGQAGNVHVFALNADGVVLSPAQKQGLFLFLEERTPLIDVHVDSLEASEVAVTARILIESANDFITTADRVWAAMQIYLTPGLLPPGESIYVKQLDRLVGGLIGVSRVQSVEIGGFSGDSQSADNYRLPYLWSVAKLRQLKVIAVAGQDIYARTYNQ